MPNSKFKYDVFVSYSRKDYVDSHGNVIDGSPIKSIIDFLDQNQISYWFDKEGVYSGREFIELISEAINDSKIMLFVSSENSNSSIYTTGEIFEAIEADRLIIPIKIDDSAYNSKFRLLLRPLDFIDFSQADAFSDLLRAINVEKERIHKREEEELLRKKKDAEEANKKIVKKEIDEYAAEVNRLMVRRHALLDTIYQKQHSIGVDKKSCPVCSTKSDIEVEYCQNCGWTFPTLSSVEGYQQTAENPLLMIARTNWSNLGSSYDRRGEKQQLVKDNKALKKALEELQKKQSSNSEQLNSDNKQSFISFMKECYSKHNSLIGVLLLISIPIAFMVGAFALGLLIFDEYERFTLGCALLACLISYGNYQLFTFRSSIWIMAPLLSFIIGGLFDGYVGPQIGFVLSLLYLGAFALISCFKKNGQRVITQFRFLESLRTTWGEFKKHNLLTRILSVLILFVSLFVLGICVVEEWDYLAGLFAMSLGFSVMQVLKFNKDGILNLVALILILGVIAIFDHYDNYLIGVFMSFLSVVLLFASLTLSRSNEIWKGFDKSYVISKIQYLFFMILMLLLLYER